VPARIEKGERAAEESEQLRQLEADLDTGVGLLAESPERIFDAFHTTKP
jgi:hypothetical protein